MIKNIIFDLGGVLLDWNPRYLYRNYFNDEGHMEHFLKNICNDEWNMEQDRGRSFADAVAELVSRFPLYSTEIKMFDEQWETMLKSEISGTVSILNRLKTNYEIFALTNWSSEKIKVAYENFSFFKDFKGIVVSGEEKVVKPDPLIYHILLERYQLKSDECLFIDDNSQNIATAKLLGFKTIHFKDASQLAAELKLNGVNV